MCAQNRQESDTIYGDPNTYVSGTEEDKEKNAVKNQVIWHIKQVLDENWTEIAWPKGTNIEYTKVAPFYYYT